MRMDDPPGSKPPERVTFIVACVILGICAFVVAFYLAAIALMS
jgi:hypothetical protein